MTIVPADSLLTSWTLSGDTWPGSSGKTELFDTTTPAFSFFNLNADGDNLTHHSISEIAESDDGCISFTFDEDATKISDLEGSDRHRSSSNLIYDLSGRRMPKQQLSPGIYVRDGHKALIR